MAPSNQARELGGSLVPVDLPLTLLRHGSGLLAFGLIFGFTIPLTPYPRLALTAHIQFVIEGIMVVVGGLVLQSHPKGGLYATSGKAKEDQNHQTMLVDRLSQWQKFLIYWGCMGVWVTLLAEAANAWWGTQWVLALAHKEAGLEGPGPAHYWMEVIVSVTHMPLSAVLATMVSLSCIPYDYFLPLVGTPSEFD